MTGVDPSRFLGASVTSARAAGLPARLASPSQHNFWFASYMISPPSTDVSPCVPGATSPGDKPHGVSRTAACAVTETIIPASKTKLATPKTHFEIFIVLISQSELSVPCQVCEYSPSRVHAISSATVSNLKIRLHLNHRVGVPGRQRV